MKRQILILFLILVPLLASACLAPDDADLPAKEDKPEAILIKIGHELAEEHPLHLALLDFVEELGRSSEGRFVVDIYPYFELGDVPELVSMTAEGIIQLSLPLGSALAALPPQGDEDYPLTIPDSWLVWGSLDGFYLHPDLAAAYAAIDGERGADMAASLADLAGIPLLCLGFAYDGPLCLAYNGSEIASPDDLARKRIGVSGSPQWLDLYRQIKAEPIALPLSEIYPSLAGGKISAYQATPTNIATMYLDDHTQSLLLTEHAGPFIRY